MEAKKNPKADLENKRTVFFQIGLIIVLAAVFSAFEWKSYSPAKSIIESEPTFVALEDELIPIIIKVSTPPPPEPIIDNSQLKIVEKIEVKKFEKPVEKIQTTELAVFIEEKEEKIEEYIPYGINAQMPTFPGCENEISEELKRNCTYKQIMDFIRDEIQYPSNLKEAGMEGKIYLEFVINKSGEVKNIRVLRGVDGGDEFSKESIRAVKKLPHFNPAMQQGREVSVIYTIPVNFSLN